MMAAGHMRPPMHNALVLGNLHEYRNKYSLRNCRCIFNHFYIICARKTTEFDEITHGNRHYAV